jgi:hypothetical protein
MAVTRNQKPGAWVVYTNIGNFRRFGNVAPSQRHRSSQPRSLVWFPVEVVLTIHKVVIVIVLLDSLILHPLPNSRSHANPIAHHAATTPGLRSCR